LIESFNPRGPITGLPYFKDMESALELLISFRTPDGFQAIGQYFLGKDKLIAEEIFAGLKGRADIDDSAVLHLDLLEITDGLPAKVNMISCRMNELCENCQHITRELFRLNAIEPR